jgi:hypothetical protein
MVEQSGFWRYWNSWIVCQMNFCQAGPKTTPNTSPLWLLSATGLKNGGAGLDTGYPMPALQEYEGKNPIVILRHVLSSCPDESPSSASSDLSFMTLIYEMVCGRI